MTNIEDSNKKLVGYQSTINQLTQEGTKDREAITTLELTITELEISYRV